METRGYSTATVARRLDIVRASVNTALYRHGHLHGIKPFKLPSGRLLWPADQIDALVSGARADEAQNTGERLAAARSQAAAADRTDSEYRLDLEDEATSATAAKHRRHAGFISPRLLALLAVAGPPVATFAASAWGWLT